MVQQLDQYGMSANIDWTINDTFSLKSISAWRKYESSWAQDVDNSPAASQQLLQTLRALGLEPGAAPQRFLR